MNASPLLLILSKRISKFQNSISKIVMKPASFFLEHRCVPALFCGAAISLIAMPSSMAAVLAGWDTWASGGESPTVTSFNAAGSASEEGDWREASAAASNDGTFGTLAGADSATGAAASGTYIGVSDNNGTPTGAYNFTVSAGINGLIIESFHFDARRKRSNSATTWSLSVTGGSISLGSVASGSLGSALGSVGPSDHLDFDIDLTGLLDNELTSGESATFRLVFSGGSYSNADQHTYLDNVAIVGSAIPEPSAVLLGVLGALGLLQRRRR
jgi:hypothetical protein